MQHLALCNDILMPLMKTTFTLIICLINLCATYAQEKKSIVLETFTINASKAPKNMLIIKNQQKAIGFLVINSWD